ncbi:hypothetical protein [Mucilaginibacter sp. SG564]|uniref:hypothetical protein n=1 Tax=Mucilaginibacter sp. SG564 TaxID=2587022 RepID=UPI0015556EB2|nr:hypothetical protein [Mucilaginibacter sp. SG564]NOW94741.1 hypothetical protein [Mucilaginibacter sp. SG564]
MKYIYTIVLLLNFLSFSWAQEGKKEYGAKFEFDSENEKDPHFVLVDNYNTYLLTVLDVYGVMAGHQVIVRKFDQKNTLVETYKYDFPIIGEKNMFNNSLFNYLGYAEGQNGKVAVFTEVYSNKTKTYQIHKVEFDKATAKFTSTVLAEGEIPSAMKSGSLFSEKSDNGNYLAINYHKYRAKGTPDKNQLIVIDTKTLSIAWQKEVSFDNEFTSDKFTVTNSGKVVLVRDMNGSKKGITYLTVISASGQEDKNFDSQIFLNELKSVSIGSQEYLIAFNSSAIDFKDEYYKNLLLYDLQSGKILSNNKIPEFSPGKGIIDVDIRNVMLQNNEMHIFAEGKTELKEKMTTGLEMMNAKPKYNFGPAYLFVTSFDGQLKATKKLSTQHFCSADLHHSFGLANVKGTYYVNAGEYYGIYVLGDNLQKEETKISFNVPRWRSEEPNQFVNQLFTYFPDKNSFLLAKVISKGEMALVDISGF